MKVFLNGKMIDQEKAVVSVLDRSFLYGDGLFETLRISQGRAFRWKEHWLRLSNGAEFLGMNLPFTSEVASSALAQLVMENDMPEALARITISRGVGLRGYSPKGAVNPTAVITLNPAPDDASVHTAAWKLCTSRHRLYSGDLLSSCKTTSKLLQVMARAEAEAAGADEALLMDEQGRVVEAATGNLFWISGETVYTPPLAGVLPGVTRSVVLELCSAMGLKTLEEAPPLERLEHAEGVFISLSSFGVVPAVSLNQRPCRRSSIAGMLQSAYLQLLRAECSRK